MRSKCAEHRTGNHRVTLAARVMACSSGIRSKKGIHPTPSLLPSLRGVQVSLSRLGFWSTMAWGQLSVALPAPTDGNLAPSASAGLDMDVPSSLSRTSSQSPARASYTGGVSVIHHQHRRRRRFFKSSHPVTIQDSCVKTLDRQRIVQALCRACGDVLGVLLLSVRRREKQSRRGTAGMKSMVEQLRLLSTNICRVYALDTCSSTAATYPPPPFLPGDGEYAGPVAPCPRLSLSLCVCVCVCLFCPVPCPGHSNVAVYQKAALLTSLQRPGGKTKTKP
ncbi:uncharacterized protein MCYG_05517 [Microsporum canis CBS 113480]|uniref:Uncharacterized protein n=1 Tax=Arthroderma otae (strain ATCC MYA-4605 / CBS 113480) TaxID=554155 RepID=C5FS45_ARTOC|nr:uncharacterized protein MCYG_05517 [Microsporum canis CBS 113480]EEQ32698.1 predicted protein [Microsporum canis CBS 113480]